MKDYYEINCPVCEARTNVEVINTENEPEHCSMCGATVDFNEEYFDEE